jgi:aminopeptidase N
MMLRRQNAIRTLLVPTLFAGPGLPLPAQVAPPVAEPEPIVAGEPAPPGRYDGDLDVLHYDIELGLGHTADWIGARTGLRIRARAPLDRVVLDFTGLAVDDVTIDGTGISRWALDDHGLLAIRLPRALADGDQVQLVVTYRGVPDDGLVLRTNVHGERTAFADNWPNRARFWFPSIDHPSDKATVRFVVHAPAAWAVAANGRLVGQPVPTPAGALGPADGPRRTWTWATAVPIPTYTMVVGAGPLVRDEVGLAACGRAPASPRPDGCVEVTTWLFAADVERGSASFRRAAAMVDFFADVVGPYPYEKLAHIQSSTRFGGMENASAIFYAEQALAQGRDIEGTVSHETAHQWFGDSVTETAWGHLWLSEGFATYFGALFFEYADGPAALRRLMAGAARSYLASPDTLRPTVDGETESLFDLLNANSYQKGAWVLHMLRDVVGDEVFFRGVRVYYERFRDSTALTDDFRRAMEEVSGEELDWFFEQWLHQPGHPVLDVGVADTGPGTVEVTVRQVQGAYAPRFRIPLELELRWEGGDRRERVQVTGATHTFRFDVPTGPVTVVVDPDGVLLKRLTGV